MDLQVFHGIPKLKRNSWKKWLEKSDESTIKFIYYLKDVLIPEIRKLGIIAEIVVLPLSNYTNTYFIDYVWDYTEKKHPDIHNPGKSVCMIVFKLDKESHFNPYGLPPTTKRVITCQHNIENNIKPKFIELMKIRLGDKFKWTGKNSKVITIQCP